MDNPLRTEFDEQLSISETLYQRIENLMKLKHISIEEFYQQTKLHRTVLYDIKRNQARPQLRIVITICIGLHLEPFESFELIEIAGYHLTKTIFLDYAYLDLICHFYEFGIAQCNERLKELGIDKKYYLGSHEKNGIGTVNFK